MKRKKARGRRFRIGGGGKRGRVCDEGLSLQREGGACHKKSGEMPHRGGRDDELAHGLKRPRGEPHFVRGPGGGEKGAEKDGRMGKKRLD